jgi:hypothetical protein
MDEELSIVKQKRARKMKEVLRVEDVIEKAEDM